MVRALTNIVGHDDPVSLEQYGQYLLSTDSGTSPIRELLDTLRWLGGAAIDALPQIEAARTSAFPGELLGNLNQTTDAIRADRDEDGSCCELPGEVRRVVTWSRRTFPFKSPTVFEQQDGARLTFDEVFAGHPTIVVFF